MSGVRALLSYRVSRPPAKTTLLRSQRSPLGRTVIRPSAPVAAKRESTPCRSTSVYESPYITQKRSPSRGRAFLRATPVPRGRPPWWVYAVWTPRPRPVPPAPQVPLDLITSVTEAQHDPAHALAVEERQLMVDERAAAHLQE